MQTFGGCAVEYNELLDSHTDGWANSLAAIVGFDSQKLLDARAQRVNGSPDRRDMEPVYREAFKLFKMMRTLSGRIVELSRQVLPVASARDPPRVILDFT